MSQRLINDTLIPEISQGDIFVGIEVPCPGRLPANACIVVTADCHFDKPTTTHVHVAPLMPMAVAKAGLWGNIRANRVRRAFPIPAIDRGEESFEECYADFGSICLVDKQLLIELGKRGERIASLSEFGRDLFAGRVWAFFGWEPPTKDE